MKDQLRREWTTLMQEGAHGQAGRFRLRALRLSQMLRNADPELSAVLAKGVNESGQLTRLQDSTTQRQEQPDILLIEDSPQLALRPHWPKPIEAQLNRIREEWKMLDALARAGLSPVSTVLLSGPPGVGKTLAARWLSERIQMPLATLNLAATMNSYLGKTGQNIMRALDYARSNACVLLLDEFDALAKRRGDDQDIGELKRVVNVLLQAIDQWHGPSLLIAATNHVSLLDEAILRRFEMSIEFPAPSQAQINKVLQSLGVNRKLATSLAMKLQGQPISNATRMVRAARKREVLEEVPFETAVRLEMNIVQHYSSPRERRRILARSLAESGMSSHQIAQQLGFSHTTILRDIKSKSRGHIK